MKRATLKDIAAACNCSIPVVSAIINQSTSTVRVSEKRAKQVLEVARKLNYRPNAAARMMRKMECWQVGVLVRGVFERGVVHPFLYDAMQGIDTIVAGSEHVSTLLRYDDLAMKSCTDLRVFREHILAGVIALGVGLTPEVLSQVEEAVPHVVYADCSLFPEINSVRRDEYYAGLETGRQVMLAGKRRVALLVRDLRAEEFHATQRIEGLEKAISDGGGSMAIYKRSSEDRSGLQDLMTHHDCLICLDIYLAQQLLAMAGMQGIAVGRELAIACCDDADASGRDWPELSRMSFDRFKLGQRAGEMLMDAINGNNSPSELLRGEWIPGSTLMPLS